MKAVLHDSFPLVICPYTTMQLFSVLYAAPSLTIFLQTVFFSEKLEVPVLNVDRVSVKVSFFLCCCLYHPCLDHGLTSHPVTSSLAVCGKNPAFDPQRPEEAHWPWLAAIYRRSSKGTETKVTKADSQAGSFKKGDGAGSGNLNQASDWQLVCSGALVNQRSVVVAAHCVTELGKVYPVDTATISVVVGKHYRDDRRENKGLQRVRVSF